MARLKEFPQGSPSVHLDALRGFAAFSVLLNHWRDAFFVDYGPIARHHPVMAAVYLAASLGHQWVIVFFVLSGYLVGGSVLRSVRAGRWSWRSYLLARVTRLYIVLLPALALGGAADWIGMHVRGGEAVYSGQSGMHSLTENVHLTLTLPAFAANSVFLQTIVLPGTRGWAAPAFGSNGPLWSLSYEFWYYLAFPVLVLLLVDGRYWQVRAIRGLGLVVWVWFVGSNIALLGVAWLMGVAIVVLPPLSTRRKWVRGLAIFSALALLGGGLIMAKLLDTLYSDLLLGMCVTLLIWVTLHCATDPLPSAYVRAAHRAAHSSYTLYLVHLPMLILLKAWFRMPRAIPSWHVGIVCLGLLFATILYAQLVYELFEKNTDRLRDWIKAYMGERQRV